LSNKNNEIMKITPDDTSLALRLKQFMQQKNATISTAESCTCGRIGATITCIDGSSTYYQGGIMAYQNWIKEQYLGVTPQMIEEHDVVSQEVVLQMAVACRRLFGTHYAIATTGYTGDGNERVLSGTIYIGFASPTATKAVKLSLPHSTREERTAAAAQTAISQFLEWISAFNPAF
jgi:PncC family amidohydrolase